MALKIDHELNDISVIGGGKPTFDSVTVSLVGHTHLVANITDIGDAAADDYGTTSGTIAAGDHLHDSRYVLLSSGSLQTIDSDVTVTGNFTVSGTVTTVNSATLDIADNVITLNSDETGTPSQNAGIEIERGTSSNVVMRWNESTDIWEVTRDGTTFYEFLDRSHIGTGSTQIAAGDHAHSGVYEPIDSNILRTSDIGSSVQMYTKETITTTNPSASNDSSSGYTVGSRWVNTTADTEFVCVDSTVSSAVWVATTTYGLWGSVTGTLSDQTDLQGELDGKSDTSHSHGATWSVVTGDITAVANNSYILDSALGTFTVTLPASPSVDDTIRFIDAGSASINNITIARNGSNINGSAENLIIDVGNAEFVMVYMNASDGWIVAGGGTLVEFIADGIESYYDHGTISSTGTVTVNINSGTWQKITYPTTGTYTVTIAFSGWPASSSRYVMLELENFGDTDATIVWPGAMKTSGGAALTLTVGGTDFVLFKSRDTGTTIYAFQDGIGMA